MITRPNFITDSNWGTVLNSGMNLSQVPTPRRTTSNLSRVTRSPISSIERSETNTSPMLNNLWSRINSMSPTTTVNTTQTTRQNRSEELENMIQSLTQQFNQRSQDTASAYDQYAATFDELQRNLADRYNTTGSAASTNALNSAISSGLTPAEAQAMAQESLLNVMQQYNPAASQLASEQAQVGVAREGALAGLMQNLQLPIAQNIMTPYYRDVAGQVREGTETTTDPYRKMQALLQAASLAEESRLRQESDALGWAQLAQGADEFTRDLALRQAALGQEGLLSGQQIAQRDRLAGMEAETAMDRLLAELGVRSGMQTEELGFRGEQGALDRQAYLDRQLQAYQLENDMVPFGYNNPEGLLGSSDDMNFDIYSFDV